MQLGEEIRRLRTEAGLSQGKLAAAIGATQAFVSHLESGERTGFSTDTLYKLCDVLKISADHFRPFLTEAAPEVEDERSQGKRK